MDQTSELRDRAQRYAALYQIRLEDRLGFGKDGVVWRTDAHRAVKVFKRRDLYDRELAVYLRLRDRGVRELCGHNVPVLEQWDDDLMVVEMQIVPRPFVLDFAGARLDGEPVEYPAEVVAAQEESIREMFGARVAKVAAIRAALTRLGIHMTDLHPGNIGFEGEADEDAGPGVEV